MPVVLPAAGAVVEGAVGGEAIAGGAAATEGGSAGGMLSKLAKPGPLSPIGGGGGNKPPKPSAEQQATGLHAALSTNQFG